MLIVETVFVCFVGIFCKREGDSTRWSEVDVGFNIWTQHPQWPHSLQDSDPADCFLRYSTKYDHAFWNENGVDSIRLNWIDPAKDTIVVIHGWQPTLGTFFQHPFSWDTVDHFISDVWAHDRYGDNMCVSEFEMANEGNMCPPVDHDSRYWTIAGWNVLFADWRFFARKLVVESAEATMYKPQHDGKNVNYIHVFSEDVNSVNLVLV